MNSSRLSPTVPGSLRRAVLVVLAVSCSTLVRGENAPPRASSNTPVSRDTKAASLLRSERTESVQNEESTDYRIAPRDLLQFQLFEEEDSLLVQRVSSVGEISVPLLGAVKVAGRTLRETEAMLEQRYRAGGFYIKPQVILSFQSYAPRSVSVLGQVNNPNQIDFSIERGTIGIVTAITRAGGFTRVARPDAVRVMRTVNGKETSFTVNVASYLDDKSTNQEFRLMPDDIVFVPERVF